jgi:membrane protein DedA with SNARE-associated domain
MPHSLDPGTIADVIASWGNPWGYIGIFVCIFLGNFGIPMPEETVLLAAGFLAGRGILDYKTVYIISVISAVVGDNFGYLMGREGGRRLLERLSLRFEFVGTRYERLRVFFVAHGNKTVFFARFLAGLRFLAGPMAGAAGMPFWSFFGWNILGAIVWCSVMVSVGYLLGDQWETVARLVHAAALWVVLAVVLLGLLAYQIWGRGRHPAPHPGP